MSKRHKLHELSAENDIRYRGPLSYQGFRILGWLCIVMAFFSALLRLAVKANPALEEESDVIITVLAFVTSMSLPFLLIANFARILDNTEGYKRQLIRTGCAALSIIVVSVVVFGRYVVGLVGDFVSDPENVLPVLTELFNRLGKTGFINYNIFIDLFLCTLFMFFLTARPKRVFVGKKMLIFRFFAILPIAYEICSIVLKGLSASGKIMLPLWTFPFLTVKPPMTFLVFVVLALFIKTREFRFCRHGKTHEEYREFLKTNRNSLHFSVTLSIIMVIAAIADIIILTVITAEYAPSIEALQTANFEAVNEYASVARAMGFGSASVPLFLASPFVLLFSYTRKPKHRHISALIPLIAIAIIFILLIEAGYQFISSLAWRVPHISIRELFDAIFGAF